MSNPNNDFDDEVSKGPLTESEISNLRRIINDYFYRRRIRKMLKVWIYTIGSVTTMMIAGTTVWKELLRLVK